MPYTQRGEGVTVPEIVIWLLIKLLFFANNVEMRYVQSQEKSILEGPIIALKNVEMKLNAKKGLLLFVSIVVRNTWFFRMKLLKAENIVPLNVSTVQHG